MKPTSPDLLAQMPRSSDSALAATVVA
jgi:hypothetical protein